VEVQSSKDEQRLANPKLCTSSFVIRHSYLAFSFEADKSKLPYFNPEFIPSCFFDQPCSLHSCYRSKTLTIKDKEVVQLQGKVLPYYSNKGLVFRYPTGISIKEQESQENRNIINSPAQKLYL
jgi:hypothetical protein